MNTNRDEDTRTRMKRITSKMIGSPFFPILFIGEAVKTYFISGYGIHPPAPETIRLTVVGILSMILYVIGDDIYSEFESGARQVINDGDAAVSPGNTESDPSQGNEGGDG